MKVGPRSVALIGGSAAGAALASIELVLLDAGQVVPGPTLAVAREGPAAEVLPGADAIVVVGGFTAPALDPAQGEGVAAVEIVQLGRPLETTSRVVCAGLTLSVPRGAPALALVPGGLLVLGGVTAPGSVTGSVERVIASDLAHCIVSVTPAAATLVMPRAMARVATLAGGDVLVTGGFDLVGGRTHSLTDAEIYVRPR